MTCPITYRSDRVSRQLRWDEDPKNVEFAFYPIEDLMKKVLFQIVLPEYDPCLITPSDRVGGVTMEYVSYLKCVKKQIKQYEGYFSVEMKSILVLVKHLYFMTGNLSPTTIASNVPSFAWMLGVTNLNHPQGESLMILPLRLNRTSEASCKHKSPRLLGKMKRIPDTPDDLVSVDDEDSKDEDNRGFLTLSTIGGVSASCMDSRYPFQVSNSSNLTKESLVVTLCDSAHNEFQYFHVDVHALFYCFASLNP
ncbi:hypothetical protein PIB30_010508 [Stylosanthes scabra]|uniref:Uncharacterized protein n=1 Tax=Stylosanthes scabra TaxID=79078 RepID=A0ABU6Q5F1_9FABA|nr:hypothetical protein [Stylosanthes scabra]